MALLAAILMITPAVGAITISRVEPAFWWTGMKNTELQIMVYGKDIARSKVTLSYPGVTIKEIAKTDNPNYLFIYLDITSKAKPGTMNIEFADGAQTYTQAYPLKNRENSGGCSGFSPADVLYLIMPDRFANGNFRNDSLDGAIVNRQHLIDRHGGDLAGIEKHLDYLENLGNYGPLDEPGVGKQNAQSIVQRLRHHRFLQGRFTSWNQ